MAGKRGRNAVLTLVLPFVVAFGITWRMPAAGLGIPLGGLASAVAAINLVGAPENGWVHPVQYLVPFTAGCLTAWIGTRIAERRYRTSAGASNGTSLPRSVWAVPLRLPAALAVVTALGFATYWLHVLASSEGAIFLARRIDGGAVVFGHVMPRDAGAGASCRSRECTVRLVKPLVATGATASEGPGGEALVVPRSAFVAASSSEWSVGAVGQLWVRVVDFVVPVDVRIVGTEHDRLYLVPQPAAAWIDVRGDVWRALPAAARARVMVDRAQPPDGGAGRSIAYGDVLVVADPTDALRPGMVVRDAREVAG
jgi:hypothetical protein